MRETKAAVMLQRSIRGYVTRRQLWLWDISALVIQLHIRGWEARMRVLKLRKANAVARLCACWRRYRDSKRFSLIRTSTMQIQMFFRFHWAKKILKKRRYEAHSLVHQLSVKQALLDEAVESATQAALQVATMQQALEDFKTTSLQSEAKAEALARQNNELEERCVKQKEEHEQRLEATIQELDSLHEAELLAATISSDSVILSKEEEIAALKELVSKLTVELETAEIMNVDKDKAIEELGSQMSQLRASEKNDAERYRLINEEWTSAVTQVVEVEAEKTNLQALLAEAVGRSNTMQLQLEQNNTQLESLQQRHDEAFAACQNKDDENSKLKTEITLLNERNEVLVVRLNDLLAVSEEIPLLRETVSNLEANNLTILEKNLALESEFANLQKQNEDLTESLTEKNLVIADLESKIDLVSSERSTLSSTLEVKSAEQNCLAATLSEVAEQAEEYRHKIKELEVCYQSVVEQKEEQGVELCKQKDATATLEDKLLSKDSNISTMQTSLADMMLKFEAMSEAKKSLDKKIKVSSKTIDQMKKSLSDKDREHKCDIDAKMAEIVELRQNNDDLSRQISSLESDKVAAKVAKDEEVHAIRLEVAQNEKAVRSLNEKIKELEDALSAKRVENSNLTDEINSLAADMEYLTRSNTDTEECLSRKLDEYKAECVALMDKNTEEMTTNHRLKEDLVHAAEELQELREGYTLRLEEIQKQRNSQENVITMLSDENAELKDNIATITNHHDSQTLELKEAHRCSKLWEDRHCSVKDQVQSLNESLAEKMDELVERTTETMVLRKCLKKEEQDKEDLSSLCEMQREELDDIMSELSQMQSILAEKNIECSSIDSSLSAKTAAVVSLSAGVLSLNEKLSELEVLLAEKNKALSGMSSSIQSLNEEVNVANTMSSELEDQLHDKLRELELLREEAVLSDGRIRDFSVQLEMSRKSVSSLTSKLSDAHQQLNSETKSVSMLSDEVETLRSELAAAKQSKASSDAAFTDKLNGAYQELNNKSEAASKLNNEVESLRDELADAKQILASTEKRLESATAEIVALQQEKENDDKKTNLELSEKVTALENTIIALQDSSNAALIEKDDIISELEASMQELVLLESLVEQELTDEGLGLPAIVEVDEVSLRSEAENDIADGIVSQDDIIHLKSESSSQQASLTEGKDETDSTTKAKIEELAARIDVLTSADIANGKEIGRLEKEIAYLQKEWQKSLDEVKQLKNLTTSPRDTSSRNRLQARCDAAHAEVVILKRQLIHVKEELDKMKDMQKCSVPISPAPSTQSVLSGTQTSNLMMDVKNGGGITHPSQPESISHNTKELQSKFESPSSMSAQTSFSYTPLRESHLVPHPSSPNVPLTLPLQSPSVSATDDLISCSHRRCIRKFTSMEGFLLHIEMEHDSLMFPTGGPELDDEDDEIVQTTSTRFKFSDDSVISYPEYDEDDSSTVKRYPETECGSAAISEVDVLPFTPKSKNTVDSDTIQFVTPSGGRTTGTLSAAPNIEQMIPSDFLSYIVDNLQAPSVPTSAHQTSTGRVDKGDKKYSCLFEGCKKKYKSEEGLIDHMKDFHILKNVSSSDNRPLYTTPNAEYFGTPGAFAPTGSSLPSSWSPELQGYVSRSLSYCRSDSDLASTVAHLKYQIAKVSKENKGRVNDHPWESERSPVKPPSRTPASSSSMKKNVIMSGSRGEELIF